MPEPLDYWNPRSKDRTRSDAPQARNTVVPPEFDRLLTRSADHPAVQSIIAALQSRGIEFFQTDDGERAGREITLHVREADFTGAATIAAEIFARRKKIKSQPRPEPFPETRREIDGPDLTYFI